MLVVYYNRATCRLDYYSYYCLYYYHYDCVVAVWIVVLELIVMVVVDGRVFAAGVLLVVPRQWMMPMRRPLMRLMRPTRST